MNDWLQFLVIILIVAFSIVSILSNIRLRDSMHRQATSVNNLGNSYIETYNAIMKSIENLSMRTDNLHSRTNDLEHDMIMITMLMPVLVDALHLETAKIFLEKNQIAVNQLSQGVKNFEE